MIYDKIRIRDLNYQMRKAIALYLSGNGLTITSRNEITIKLLIGSTCIIKVYDYILDDRVAIFESQFDTDSEEIIAIYRVMKTHE